MLIHSSTPIKLSSHHKLKVFVKIFSAVPSEHWCVYGIHILGANTSRLYIFWSVHYVLGRRDGC